MTQDSRRYAAAWMMALAFYVLEYATRSAPAVMIPQLQQAFGQSGVGVSSILGSYYYAYALTSLVAGLALDRVGARHVVPFGAFIMGLGCVLFTVDDSSTAYLARLLQGAGSAFSFTGAVYLASRGFSASSLATAIGVTQCLGMLGGSGGQFLVGPLLQAGIGWKLVWIALGFGSIAVAVALLLITPSAVHVAGGGLRVLLAPYRMVLRNPQSLLCGLIAGLLFAPTTIGAMTWGVAYFQADRGLDYGAAVQAAALVPLGWAIGCPLMGWLADRMGRRKPVLAAGAVVMLLSVLQLGYAAGQLPAWATLLLLGIASGGAMIPYSIIKEANPDGAKGSATGAINFINFGVTALLGPIFAGFFASTLHSGGDPVEHFQQAAAFWSICVVLALLLMIPLRETGHRSA